MFREAYLDIMRFIEMGGDVLWFIALITFIMWTLIFERIWFFRMEYRGMMEELIQSWNGRSERNSWTARQIRDGVISDATDRISGTLPIIQTCVASNQLTFSFPRIVFVFYTFGCCCCCCCCCCFSFCFAIRSRSHFPFFFRFRFPFSFFGFIFILRFHFPNFVSVEVQK